MVASNEAAFQYSLAVGDGNGRFDTVWLVQGPRSAEEVTMRNMMARVALVLAILACAQGAQTPAHDPVADKAAVDAVRNAEMAALNSGNVDSIMAVYAEDVDMMAPGVPTTRGAAAVRDMLIAMMKDVTLSGSYTTSVVEVSGDVAIDRFAGSLTMTPRAGGPAVTEMIKGLHVLRRQPDGSWKIVQDVWNVDAPPAPPAK
jgi:uncharacterized protein (TIGR02246 family)